MRSAWIRLCAVLVCLLPASVASAHVGSKDVFETVHAGPYTLYVTVRPPNVIPGVATVEVRCSGAAVNALKVTPLLLTGDASKHPPAGDVMTASSGDAAFYTGAVWIMASGTWQVRFDIDGAGGHQVGSVPVVAVPISVLKMDKGMGTVLALLGLFLIVAMAGIVAASVGEARLQPGIAAPASFRRRTLIAAVASLALMAFAVYWGGRWWNVEAADYSEHIYKAAPLTVTLTGSRLDLKPGSAATSTTQRRPRANEVDHYLLDHGKVMHLYAIRVPEMDIAFHLHPKLMPDGDFRDDLPAMPAGDYKLYADVVHASGFPETLVGTLEIDEGMPGGALAADDAEAIAARLSEGELPPEFHMPDGYSMVWDKPAALTAGAAYSFTFHLVDDAGKPATDMQPYLGMAGHAAFVKMDGSVFAHTHPEGSAAMADVMLANESLDGMPGMSQPGPIAPDVSFPYGFPTPGRYRIFIQMKHGGTVETGVFDADVK